MVQRIRLDVCHWSIFAPPSTSPHPEISRSYRAREPSRISASTLLIQRSKPDRGGRWHADAARQRALRVSHPPRRTMGPGAPLHRSVRPLARGSRANDAEDAATQRPCRTSMYSCPARFRYRRSLRGVRSPESSPYNPSDAFSGSSSRSYSAHWPTRRSAFAARPTASTSASPFLSGAVLAAASGGDRSLGPRTSRRRDTYGLRGRSRQGCEHKN